MSEGYIEAMGIPLRAGRFLTERDTLATDRVALLNETAARTPWPGRNPIGQIMMADGSANPGRRVVGVVGDVRHRALEQGAGSEVYIPMRQWNDNNAMYLVARTSLPPETLASSLRIALHPIAPDLATNEFRTMQELVDKAVSPRRFVVVLLAGFSGFALILAALGIYAVISSKSAHRGARHSHGLGRVDRQLTIEDHDADPYLGWSRDANRHGGRLDTRKSAREPVFGVTFSDPAHLPRHDRCSNVVAAVAGYLPALRVSKIEPIAALRAN